MNESVLYRIMNNTGHGCFVAYVRIEDDFVSSMYPPFTLKDRKNAVDFMNRAHISMMFLNYDYTARIYAIHCEKEDKIFAVESRYSHRVPLFCPYCLKRTAVNDSGHISSPSFEEFHKVYAWECNIEQLPDVYKNIELAETLLQEKIPRLSIVMFDLKEAVLLLSQKRLFLVEELESEFRAMKLQAQKDTAMRRAKLKREDDE